MAATSTTSTASHKSCFAALSSKRARKLLSMDAQSLSKAIEKKQVSCEELMQATLARIHEVNPKCNAIILLRKEQELLAEARLADQTARKGWLHGIPIAVKDLCNVKGIPTTLGGSPLSSNFVPTANDFFVGNFVKDGAIIIGKTNTPENGLGSHTYNGRWGTTLNPFDLSKSAGGSSGGAGVAVSTRMLCLADGTDMMGSLRNPAGWNNIYSHRPTAGMIRGAIKNPQNPLPYPISTPGPMARTPIDCARLLETMVGDKNLFSASSVSDSTEDTAIAPSLEGVKIGWLGDWGGQLPLEDGILSLCELAMKESLEGKKCAIVESVVDEIFPLSRLWTSWNRIRSGTTASMFSQFYDLDIILGENSVIKKELQWEIKQGLETSEAMLEQAGQDRNDFAKCLEPIFAKYDVLALPSAQLFPFPQEWRWPTKIEGTGMDTYHRWMQVCVPVTLGGLPCTTVPAGLGKSGLPIGIQLFAQRNEDSKLLKVAQAYHETVDWPSKVKFSEDDNAILKWDT